VSYGVLAAPPALRTLVAGIVDYAGLFPPASLEMSQAVANYATYRAGADAWMLGRFVVPVSRLGAWRAAVAASNTNSRAAWHDARLSALLSDDFAHEAHDIAEFNVEAPFGVRIDAVEARTSSRDAIAAVVAALPNAVTLYCELPHWDDPALLLRAVKSANARAKIRTGGVTPDAFPVPAEIVRFLRRCIEEGVTAKATAGLHHPLRGAYRLTYEPGAVRGEMFGYVNLFLCAAALRDGVSDAVATALLLLDDASAISMDGSAIRIDLHDTAEARGVLEIQSSTLAAMRVDGIVAFGSCSFREPVDELEALFVRS
jgi:hypothetical protein